MPFEKRKVSADNLAVRSWALAHQAGVFTYPHQDADGEATYAIVVSGVKLWTLYFSCDPTQSRDQLLQHFNNLCDPDANVHPQLTAETVCLYPGDLLIQPPGQFHSVYTPTAAFTIGGHFYSYECFHLTEIARYFDVTLKGELTNQVHHHSLETLMQMIVGLPHLDRERKLKKNTLLALCLMVIHPKRYRLKVHDTIRSTQVSAYCQTIATDIVNSMGGPEFDPQHPYFGKRSYVDAGEDVDWILLISNWLKC
ncbi:hypothetical protein JVT61DRAFT_9138 [Boletus reticuloceps]|nr:hypothetical protein JVT61DRAFT_9138 [Boletus reticuloceps]